MVEDNDKHPATSPMIGPSPRDRHARFVRVPRRFPFMVLVALVLAISLSACSLADYLPSTTGSTATETPAASSSPSSSTATGSSAATPSSGTPSSDVVAAVKQVIQKANDEQTQALANNDPTAMQDTSTASNYQQDVLGLQSLSSAGVTAIHLADLKWGDITQQDASTVQVTTTETWDATMSDGSTQQQTDTNVYTLVKENGTWKIQSDEHPDSGTLQSSPGPSGSTGSSGSSGVPGMTTIPSSLDVSQNWSGYAATGGTFTGVSGTWTVPSVGTSTDPAADAAWVGIGGVSSTDLIQAGTQAIVENGQVDYAAWIETLPQASHNVPLTVHPGDKVSVSITQQSTDNWLIVMKNLTTGQSYQTTVYYQSSLSSAEWIEESPSAGMQQAPLDDFGKVSFSNASTIENGKSNTIKQADGQPITMAGGMGQALAQTSDLGSDGSSFSVTRTDVSSQQFPSGGRHLRGSNGLQGIFPQD